ncbi:hypothetical protein [Bartonella apis]|uniref:hypothetical protein n=1 Tax=Bartonella apis TaxID=1686310 RepID=UPI00242FFC0A|nr:hypothetical protein [Bartonella apis]
MRDRQLAKRNRKADLPDRPTYRQNEISQKAYWTKRDVGVSGMSQLKVKCDGKEK